MKDLMTDKEAARYLSIKVRTLRAWRASRGLPHIKITSWEIRYRRSDLDDWLAKKRTVI